MIKQQTKKTGKLAHASLGPDLAGVLTSVSFSCPATMKPVIQQRALELDLTVSQYIRRLINSDLESVG